MGCVAYIIKAVRDDTGGKGCAHGLTAVGEEGKRERNGGGREGVRRGEERKGKEMM